MGEARGAGYPGVLLGGALANIVVRVGFGAPAVTPGQQQNRLPPPNHPPVPKKQVTGGVTAGGVLVAQRILEVMSRVTTVKEAI
jgi:hypothetical protein